MTHIDRRSLSLFGLAAMLSPSSAFAAEYPTRPIHLIVGFTPGASSDIVARLYAKGAGPIVGQDVVVENKTGAGGSIAAGYVARAAKDGYTLFSCPLSTLTYKIVHPEAPFDMARNLAPVALLASGPLVMAVDPKLGVNSVKEFAALAKSKPGQILFGTVGPGSLPDLAGELYAQRAGVKLVQVPYGLPCLRLRSTGRELWRWTQAPGEVSQGPSGGVADSLDEAKAAFRAAGERCP